MTFFTYHAGELHAEQVPLSRVAQQVGTPAYVYSRAAIESQWRALDDAFGDYPHTICYAVKANSNIAILNLLARLGSGFDIVSEGELRRVLAAGGDPAKVVYSGVAKSVHELEFALKSKVRSINIESVAELHRLQTVAASLGVTASIAIRVNPAVDPETEEWSRMADVVARINPGDVDTDYLLALEALKAGDVAGFRRHLETALLDKHAKHNDIMLRRVGVAVRAAQRAASTHAPDGKGLLEPVKTPPSRIRAV